MVHNDYSKYTCIVWKINYKTNINIIVLYYNTMSTNNSPKKTLSRLIHSDYFDYVADFYMKGFIPVIYLHIDKCQYIKCKHYKDLIDKGQLTFNSFRHNEEYFKFMENQTLIL